MLVFPTKQIPHILLESSVVVCPLGIWQWGLCKLLNRLGGCGMRIGYGNTGLKGIDEGVNILLIKRM